MDGWKTSFLLGRPIFRCYVSFREGRCFSFFFCGYFQVSYFRLCFRRCIWSFVFKGRISLEPLERNPGQNDVWNVWVFNHKNNHHQNMNWWDFSSLLILRGDSQGFVLNSFDCMASSVITRCKPAKFDTRTFWAWVSASRIILRVVCRIQKNECVPDSYFKKILITIAMFDDHFLNTVPFWERVTETEGT